MKSLETVYNDMFKGKTLKIKDFLGHETVILVESIEFHRDYSDIHLDVTGTVLDKSINYYKDTTITVSLSDMYEVL